MTTKQHYHVKVFVHGRKEFYCFTCYGDRFQVNKEIAKRFKNLKGLKVEIW